ncbi:MAG: anaerobic sulfatase maturase [Saccharofermentanales bacterium]
MPHLNVMIKPASGMCNMRCQYCFYEDEMQYREEGCRGFMNIETLDKTLQMIFEYADQSCSISWQGGEPTLAGLDFFQKYVELEEKHNSRGIPVYRAIQTNGYKLSAEWASFFAQNRFLAGISVDGIQRTHDKYRKDPSGNGTFNEIIKTLNLFNKFNVDYNILTVVHKETAEAISEIYQFYKENCLLYQQYIACLDPIDFDNKENPQEWSLTAEAYGKFLIRLFDLWYEDALKGRAPYIRQFENYLDLMFGIMPESCEQRGLCAASVIIEADGSVYPCDFYMTDDYLLGTVQHDSIEKMLQSQIARDFEDRSRAIPEACKNCQFFYLCRNGCYRHRIVNENADLQNRFCRGYLMFFEHVFPKLQHLAQLVARNR